MKEGTAQTRDSLIPKFFEAADQLTNDRLRQLGQIGNRIIDRMEEQIRDYQSFAIYLELSRGAFVVLVVAAVLSLLGVLSSRAFVSTLLFLAVPPAIYAHWWLHETWRCFKVGHATPP
jgi:hypothetical protein